MRYDTLIMVRLQEEGPVRDFRDKLDKQRYSPSTRTSPPEPPLIKNQVVLLSFFCYFFLNLFFYNPFTLSSFSCFASFVPCLVNDRAEVQAEVATQVEQETGNRNLKDQVLQPQRCRSHGPSGLDA